MKVINFPEAKTYTTPWGHEFKTSCELDAFIEGAEWALSNIVLDTDTLEQNIRVIKNANKS